MIRSFTVVALMCMTSGEQATAFDLKETLKEGAKTDLAAGFLLSSNGGTISLTRSDVETQHRSGKAVFRPVWPTSTRLPPPI
jgi:hypothetical protein